MEKTITEIEPTSKVLKLLGDKTRLTMMALLMKRELCVCEFQEVFDMSQPSISQHLRKLKDFGLVKEARKGQWIYYALNKNNEFFPLIEYVTKLVPDQEEAIKQIDKSNPTLRCGC
ncbi:ArsR/SmtB family transcription factor [Heyndrickxia vini]|uniref:Winged helix-turn-helix transcriptional regulator n=1 Tax=Heyndrickxia vini TaxID=1476025 RepID=A0ABX7E1N3_9BACI|nr:metalloregulator ArsR/SmtB family transcription factor [Heyndrickxia vini]QQZ09638.1 winged helix-turn-helix transcriptional regulator [Heyndrickxia vini]